jgi:hypothetical protein
MDLGLHNAVHARKNHFSDTLSVCPTLSGAFTKLRIP